MNGMLTNLVRAARNVLTTPAGTGRPRRGSGGLGVEGLEGRDCPATLTIQGYAAALVQQVQADARTFAVDVVRVELTATTATGGTLFRDAVAVYSAARGGSVGGIFAAESQLGKDAVAEAVLVQGLNSKSPALLANKGIQGDAASVVKDASLVNDLVTFLARHQQAQTPPSAYQLQQQTAQSNAQNASLSVTNSLAGYNWGGDTSLAATATAGLAPVGFNGLLSRAGLAGWKIPGINM